MQVILKESVEKLGRTGDVVKVSDGYARNYLIPRNLVIIADEKNRKAIEHNKKVLEKKRLAEKASAEELSQKISGQSCTIQRKVGDKDKLFGSVTTADIAAELSKSGLSIDKKQIHLDEPIKALGVHTVTIKLQPEVTASVKVWVVKEE